MCRGVVLDEHLLRTMIAVSKRGTDPQVRLTLATLQHVLSSATGERLVCRGFRAANETEAALSRLPWPHLMVLVAREDGATCQLMLSIIDDGGWGPDRDAMSSCTTLRDDTLCSAMEVIDVDKVRIIRRALWVLKHIEQQFVLGYLLRDAWSKVLMPMLFPVHVCKCRTSAHPLHAIRVH